MTIQANDRNVAKNLDHVAGKSVAYMDSMARTGFSRRSFLTWAGVGLATAVTGCATEAGDEGEAAADPISSADWGALGSKLKGKLILPGQSAYATARLSFNPLFDGNMPAGVVQVASAADVQQCIAFARSEGLPVAARSGGHSYAGYSTPDRGLVVDLAPLSTISVSGDIATIGTGCRLGDVYATLGAKGVCIPGGSCPTVGIGGVTLGGGIGVLTRLRGLTCDNLVGADIVLPDSTLKTVSESDDPDLFWALRGGGGGNFGIVTSFKFRTFAAPGINVFSLRFPAGSAANVLAAWQSWMQSAPAELWSTCVVSAGNPATSRISGSFVGTSSALAGLLAQVKKAAKVAPVSESSSAKSYLDAMKYFGGCSKLTTEQCHLATPGGPGQLGRESFYASSRVVGAPIADPSKIASLVKAYSGMDLLFDSLGAKVSEVAADATAFPHRSAIASVQIYKGCSQATRATATQQVGEVQRALAGIVGGGAYANYIDPNQADWAQATFGANLPKLQAVATRYDPDRVFGTKQGIHATLARS